MESKKIIRRAVCAVAFAAAVFAASSVAQAANQCTGCGGVAPAGWRLCQKCKNEQERQAREEARQKRQAELEEARRRKEAAAREEKLKKAVERASAAPAAAAQPVVAAAAAAPAATSAAPAATAGIAALPGLFGVKFGDPVGEGFVRQEVDEGGRMVTRYTFTPQKRFRGFTEYFVRAADGGSVYEIVAHRRYVTGPETNAKHVSNAEYEDCVALLAKKFGRALEPAGETLGSRASELRFLAGEGYVAQTLKVRVERNMDRVDAARYGAEGAVEAEIDLVYDLWITATDNVGLLRSKRDQEASDLDAL